MAIDLRNKINELSKKHRTLYAHVMTDDLTTASVSFLTHFGDDIEFLDDMDNIECDYKLAKEYLHSYKTLRHYNYDDIYIIKSKIHVKY